MTAAHNKRMKLTGAAILVSRGMKVLQAAPAAYPYRPSTLFSLKTSSQISDIFVELVNIFVELVNSEPTPLLLPVGRRVVSGSWRWRQQRGL